MCRFGAPVGGARLDVIDRLSGQSALRIDAPPNARMSLPLNLDALAPGRYGLLVDGAPDQDFYLDGGAVMLGVVAVYPGGAAQAPFMDGGQCVLDANGRLVADPAWAPVYTLSLAARQTATAQVRVCCFDSLLTSIRSTRANAADFSGPQDSSGVRRLMLRCNIYNKRRQK